MKKTTNIHLNGLLFHLEEEAFQLLEKYLNAIRKKYHNTAGCDEIMHDIESRIGEMFSAKIKLKSKEVITIDDVKSVISTLGRPEDFEMESAGEQTGQKTYKKLYRDPDDTWLGGVCSGIAAYLGIRDPLVIRIFCIVFLVVSLGTTALVYFILWLLIPKAKTAAEKLEMRGEPVNINNIGKKIEEEWDNFRNRVTAMF